MSLTMSAAVWLHPHPCRTRAAPAPGAGFRADHTLRREGRYSPQDPPLALAYTVFTHSGSM